LAFLHSIKFSVQVSFTRRVVIKSDLKYRITSIVLLFICLFIIYWRLVLWHLAALRYFRNSFSWVWLKDYRGLLKVRSHNVSLIDPFGCVYLARYFSTHYNVIEVIVVVMVSGGMSSWALLLFKVRYLYQEIRGGRSLH
jgi:hypothetical protein